jgi:hypothetical protein
MNDRIEIKPSEMVAQYIQLRDQKKAAEEQYNEFMRVQYGEPMEALEAKLLELLNALGIDQIACSLGTVYRKLSTSVTVADSREFRRHVIGDEAWDLLDWRANKTAVNDIVDRNEPLPPGINRTTFMTIHIRRK